MDLPSLTVFLHWIQIFVSFYNLYVQNAWPFGAIGNSSITDVGPKPLSISVGSSSTFKVLADRGTISITISSEGLNQQRVSEEVRSANEEAMDILKPYTQPASPINGSQAAFTGPSVTHLSVNTFKAHSHRRHQNIFGTEKPLYEAKIDIEAEFSDVVALGRVLARLAPMKNVVINWLKWTLRDETRADLESKCRQEAARKLVTKMEDYTRPLGLEHFRATYFSERHRRNREPWGEIAFMRMEESLPTHDELDVDSGPPPASYEFEPQKLEIKSEIEANFDVW